MQLFNRRQLDQLPVVQFLADTPCGLGQASELGDAQKGTSNRHEVMITRRAILMEMGNFRESATPSAAPPQAPEPSW